MEWDSYRVRKYCSSKSELLQKKKKFVHIFFYTENEYHFDVPLAFHSEREVDYSSPSRVEVKEWVELYLHSPNTPSWRGTQGEHRDEYYFNLELTVYFYNTLHNGTTEK
jgi:hypothetical protein